MTVTGNASGGTGHLSHGVYISEGGWIASGGLGSVTVTGSGGSGFSACGVAARGDDHVGGWVGRCNGTG